MIAPDTIKFFTTRGPYGSFSNFAKYPITIFGKFWPTSEHFYQAMKFDGVNYEYVEVIRTAKSAWDAATLGRVTTIKMREDWDQYAMSGLLTKDKVMLTALRAKFNQHAGIREILLSTGAARIVEQTTTDMYWGEGSNGQGKNMLGILLMQLRTELLAADNLLII